MYNIKKMAQEEIEVLVAGPEHEVYVDTILETIAEAAKVRGTGIAKRTHEYLAKKMFEAKAVIALTKDGRSAICDDQRSDSTPRLPRSAHCQAHQGHDVHTGPYPLAPCQDILVDQRCCRHEDEHRTGLPTGNLCRSDRRRSLLEGL